MANALPPRMTTLIDLPPFACSLASPDATGSHFFVDSQKQLPKCIAGPKALIIWVFASAETSLFGFLLLPNPNRTHHFFITCVNSNNLAFIENKPRHDAPPQQLALAPLCHQQKPLSKQELWHLCQCNGSKKLKNDKIISLTEDPDSIVTLISSR